MCSPVINNEVCRGELVRVEQERRNAQGKDRDPEVDDPSSPQRDGDVEQHHQLSHAEIDTGASETRVENAEGYPGSRKPTTGRDVSSTTEGQITRDRMRVDTRGEDFECGRQRREVLAQTKDCLPSTTLHQF